ncbi:hypothetical protein Taro_001727, partial [Colocasia esculenta]|nr:hypothetical protein [Colocasia esculenta]
LIRRQGPWTPSSCLASIDHAADPESAARDRRLVLLERTVGCIVGDTVPLEEAAETDSERSTRYTDVGRYDRTGVTRAVTEIAMASRGRRGGVPARDDEQRREERAEQQAPAPQGPVLPPPPPVDYGVFMQGLVQAMQTQAHTQAALQAQLEA